MNHIEFSVEEYRPDWGRWSGVVPIVDDVSLLTRIHDYEAAQGFDLPGSYAGLEPPNTGRVSAWVRYLLGEVHPEDNEPSDGTVEMIAGSLPTRQKRLTEAWGELHQAELRVDWELLQGGRLPSPIEPLR